MRGSTAFLMYHELRRDGRPLCQAEPGYTRYCITEGAFAAQLEQLVRLGYRGVSVSGALHDEPSAASPVAITFDDGCETDYSAAAPLLERNGFNATFYVVSGWVGRDGYMSAAQLRDLAARGFEIGSHSKSHPYLPDLQAVELREEVARSKDELEQLLGSPVVHFSCPGGRWSPDVAAVAREAGYQSVATSRISLNGAQTDRYRLARIAVKHQLSPTEFGRITLGKGLWLQRTQSDVLAGAKKVLGNGLYERVRGGLLSKVKS